MSGEKTILLIGLDPQVVDYERWPMLTPEKILGGLETDRRSLEGEGYRVALCLIDRGETAEQTVRAALAETPVDAVLIGAGVRKDDALFLLFERLINLLHAEAPGAKICFNTQPSDTAEAVRRWL
ncbi:MAG: hypothetical protein NXI21_06365 [Alphaproteobacteria bacterium]|nr:hypothetical protein [Alphaproteobacteria bacterium]